MKAMIDGGIWNDPDFEDVASFNTIGVYIYLMTNESCNTLGLYRLNTRKAMHDTRLSEAELMDAIKELHSSKGGHKVEYSQETKWLWVVGLFKHNMKAIKNKSIAKSVLNMLSLVKQDGCPYVSLFSDRYDTSLSLVRHQCDTIIGIGIDNGTGKEEHSKGFLSFWDVYPRKIKKGKAWDSWQKMRCESMAVKVIDAIKAQVLANDWLTIEQKFVPHATTWLNQERWQDEIDVSKKKLPMNAGGRGDGVAVT